MIQKVLIIWLACSGVLYPQGSSSSMGSLKLPLFAREASLSRATVADAFSSSFLSNPALLTEEDELSFSLSHEEWIADIRSESFTSAIPVSFGTLAFSANSTGVGGIQLREIPGPPLGEFTARSASFTGTASFRITERISGGFSVKYLYEKIFIDNATGYGFDAGITYQPSVEGLRTGLSVLNVGSMNRFRVERANLPTNVLMGASYSLSFGDFLFLLLGTESLSLEDQLNSLRLGAETTYLNTLFFRLGYESGFNSRGFSYGFGVHYGSASVDYACIPFALSLGNAHVITIGLSL